VSRTFVDTSAILALLNPKEEEHARARRVFDTLRRSQASLVTTSYVLVETYALLGRRMGLGAVRACRSEMVPLFEVAWIEESLHEEALDLLFAQSKRRLSLVDAASFVVMRRLRLDQVFAFDPHFEEEGFTVL
jgi:uncharacterized protein